MIKELVQEMINNANENGYEDHIKGLSDEDLAYDMWMSTDDLFYCKLKDIVAAVKEIRNG